MKKKYLLNIAFIASLSIPVGTVISCGIFNGNSGGDKSDLDFYNYEAYISTDSEKGINQYYNFETFGDLPDLETYIKQEKAVGGIGSDYFNVGLAKKGLIKKLDLSRIFNLPSDRNEWENKLQEIYTPEVWKILNSFDAALGDIDKDGINDKLWEYSVPYFNQNKVIAFNKKAIKNTSSILNGVNLDNNNDIQAWFKNNSDLSYQEILSKLNQAGAKNITINDYFRDNMMIGSEVLDRKNNPNNFHTVGNPGTLENGKKQIDAFINMINNVNWSKRKYLTSGGDTLETIVTQPDNSRDSDVALMYNGDAMAAISGGYNGGVKDEVRIVVPKNSTFLTDGIIMSNFIKDDLYEQDRFYKVVKNYITIGSQTSASYPSFKGKWNKAWANYDYVNYTPAYKSIYEYMNDNYFKYDKGGEDTNKKFIGQATRVAATGGFTTITNPTHALLDISSRLSQPIDANIRIKFYSYFSHQDKDF